LLAAELHELTRTLIELSTTDVVACNAARTEIFQIIANVSLTSTTVDAW